MLQPSHDLQKRIPRHSKCGIRVPSRWHNRSIAVGDTIVIGRSVRANGHRILRAYIHPNLFEHVVPLVTCGYEKCIPQRWSVGVGPFPKTLCGNVSLTPTTTSEIRIGYIIQQSNPIIRGRCHPTNCPSAEGTNDKSKNGQQ